MMFGKILVHAYCITPVIVPPNTLVEYYTTFDITVLKKL
jgi:hypothetical protein